jgi:hypothetical protein
MKIVISLYDRSGVALVPWAEAGYDCQAYDIVHDGVVTEEYFQAQRLPSRAGLNLASHYKLGSITYRRADLHNAATVERIISQWAGKVAFLSAFPPCTDTAASGAKHFARKRAKNPGFQTNAVEHVKNCARIADRLGSVPYYIEHPVSVVSTLWRKPDEMFHPFEFGGYLPEDDEHPDYPDIILPRDAYPKRTCLWTGNGFIMPPKKAVDVPAGYSLQFKKLGGRSEKTKSIRSQTPRGFSLAVFEANWRTHNGY